jgi:phage regulator Rha-like protein
MSKKGRGGRRTVPYAFTEHGALMAANVLNSERAVEMSVYVIRAFVSMRRELTRHRDLARRLAEMEKTLIGHDAALRDLYDKIRALLLPPAAAKPRGIGFHVKEAAARYHRRPVRRV